MTWSKKQREAHSETMKLVAIFRKCGGCLRENATKLKRLPYATLAVCSYCGHEAVMARYSTMRVSRAMAEPIRRLAKPDGIEGLAAMQTTMCCPRSPNQGSLDD